MFQDRTFSAASRRVADPQNRLMATTPHGLVLIDDFQHMHRVRKPRVAVISGSARYDAPTTTIDVTDYREIKAPAQTAKRTNRFLGSVVGPLVAFAAAAVVAITFSLTPASDGPAAIAGPLSGHSILHFPR